MKRAEAMRVAEAALDALATELSVSARALPSAGQLSRIEITTRSITVQGITLAGLVEYVFEVES